MKRLTLLLLFLLAGLSATAQVDLADVVKRLDRNRIKASFTCTVQNDVAVEYKGSAIAEGKMFAVKVNGMEAYCDGEKVVIIDPEAKEAYIEKASDLESYLKENMGNLSDLHFSELRFMDKSPDCSEFCFDTGKLDRSWVVTDLRQE